MLDTILGFIWPPYGWYLKKRKWDAEERTAFVKFYKEEYIPFLKRESERVISEYHKPSFASKYLRPRL